MKFRLPTFFLVLLTIFAACNSQQRPTPTPFAEGDVTEQALDPARPLNVSITDLVADPEAYANAFVELTGRYQRLPLLVCDTDPRPSPATWQLVAQDGTPIAVGGFDSQVRPLLPNDLTMTVAGVWQLFEGPVGCGKNATGTQIWYLKASDIISPSPIARVTLTPTGSAEQIAEGGEGTAVATPDSMNTAQPTPTSSSESPPNTPSSASTTVPATPGSESPPNTPSSAPGSSDPTNTPTPDGEEAESPTPDSNSSPTPDATSGTPTPTGSGGGSGSPTPTTSALSTATRNPNDFDVVEFDDLSSELPVLELLAAEETHLWPIQFEYDGVITVTAIAESNMNLVLEIMNPANDVVQQANNGGNGALETIANIQLNVALNYKIRVYDLNGTEGEYCLIFNEEGGFPDNIKGRMNYGQTVNQTIEVLAINYWCFMGSSGDNITISSTAVGSAGDFVVALYGPPDAEAIGDVYTDAELANIILPEDGMYMIGILDFEAGVASYSLTLTQN